MGAVRPWTSLNKFKERLRFEYFSRMQLEEEGIKILSIIIKDIRLSSSTHDTHHCLR